MEDIITRLMNMPAGVSAFTIRDNSGDYNVFVNCNMSHERQMQAYSHELQHIRAGDFDRPGSADLIEIRAHRME